MDAVADLGRNPVRKHQVQPGYGDKQADKGRAGEPVTRDQILRLKCGQGNTIFLCLADHEQDRQPTQLIILVLYVMTIHILRIIGHIVTPCTSSIHYSSPADDNQDWQPYPVISINCYE